MLKGTFHDAISELSGWNREEKDYTTDIKRRKITKTGTFTTPDSHRSLKFKPGGSKNQKPIQTQQSPALLGAAKIL